MEPSSWEKKKKRKVEKTSASSSLTFSTVTCKDEVNYYCQEEQYEDDSNRCPQEEEEEAKTLRNSSALSSSMLTFSAVTSNEALVDDMRDFGELSRSAQYRVFRAIKEEMIRLCTLNKLSDQNITEFLEYIVSDITRERRTVPSNLDAIIKQRMSSLSLPERNLFIKFLTHSSDGTLNIPVLNLLPSCKNRSEQLLHQKARKVRNDKIDLQFISEFMHDYCRVNTFGSKVRVDEGVFHAVHEYNDTLRNIYLDDFQQSEEFQAFCNRTGRSSIGFSKFKVGALSCRCIQQPSMRVCVDEIETEFIENVATLRGIWLKSKSTCNCAFCTIEKGRKEAGKVS